MTHFLKKIQKNIWKYHYIKIWKYLEISKFWSYDQQLLRYRPKQSEISNFRSFFCPITPLKTQKMKMLKNWNNNAGDINILHMST